MVNEATFEISVTGNITDEKWVGVFTCKKTLSFQDHLRADQFRRQLLGPDSQNASPDALTMAEIFSQLHVRLLDAPGWWKEQNNGLALRDYNVAQAIYNEAMGVEKKYHEELQKKKEKAVEELKSDKAR